jgi:protein arginine kinase activator
MLCERCKKEEATIHLTEIIQDTRSDVNLCEACAREIGLNSKLSKFSLSLPDIFSFIEMDEFANQKIEASPVCGVCGTTFETYARHGKLGCPDCYTYLSSVMGGIIKGYHGDKKHIGKAPRAAALPELAEASAPHPERSQRSACDVDELHEKLQDAVACERYEEAALLRDKIRCAAQARPN